MTELSALIFILLLIIVAVVVSIVMLFVDIDVTEHDPAHFTPFDFDHIDYVDNWASKPQP